MSVQAFFLATLGGDSGIVAKGSASVIALTDGEKAALTKDWLEMFKEANNLRLVDHSICAITEALPLAVHE
jgi:hypothetical protein